MKNFRKALPHAPMPGLGPERASPEVASAKIMEWRTAVGLRPRTDWLAREEPLELRLRGQSLVVTMRTPGQDRELAAGFLYTESLVARSGDIIAIDHCQRGASAHDQNIVNIFLRPKIGVNLRKVARHGFVSSSCGLCGKAAIESVHQQFRPVNSDLSIYLEQLVGLPEHFRRAQETFAQTGGLHAAAIFNEKLELIVLREDIGRHNAVDKVIGHGLLTDQLPFERHLLLVSGRASFEILQKALAARIPVIAAISAPSSLAVDFARESNQTLVGFLRNRSLNIYSGAERIRSGAVETRKTKSHRLTARSQ